MALAASSSSSIVSNSCKYDVFISFRGPDTRYSFTSHLHAALKKAGILAFIDSEDLVRGEQISTLFTTIEQSRLSIVIFSKNYASSGWCLDELVCIMKCNKEKQHVVLPVFHGIYPSAVRCQEGSYADAFAQHEKHKDKTMKVPEWKKALKAAADLSGFVFQNGSVPESQLVDKIVKEILEKLYSMSEIRSDAFTGLVGMEKRFKKIESSLCVGSQDVRIIGIWGMGGIGKTTLARTVYDQFSSQFEGCFSLTFRGESNEDELLHLEKVLISSLLEDNNLDRLHSCFANERLRRKMVLIFLDNVNHPKQLECLYRPGVSQQIKDRFGVGSRIILTSRDRKLLEDAGAEIYNVEALDFDEARRLFCRKAFGGDSPRTDLVELSQNVLWYAKGNPLALDVLGSHLRNRSVREWESTLEKLKRAPNENIHKVLKISYDALDDETKSIFLDIALFFQYEDRDFVEAILGVESYIGIEILIEKSLIRNYGKCGNYGGKLSTHDLLREMASEIVKRESKEVGRRSRLHNAQDVYDVLQNSKGTAEIEGIFCDLCGIPEDLWLSSTVFKDMRSLRFLIIKSYEYTEPVEDFPLDEFDESLGYLPTNIKSINFPEGLGYLPDSLRYRKRDVKSINFPEGLGYLPDSLRYFKWDGCPVNSLPSNFNPHNLVILKMRKSRLKELWNGVQHLWNLKEIDLSCSQELIKLPDLSKAPKLEKIDLKGCSSLRGLPNIHASLKYLNLSGSGIEALPSSFGSIENIVRLQLRSCDGLKNLPELPTNIEILDLRFCRSLESLPSNIWKLKSLQTLNLTCCRSLKIFPEGSEVLEHLHFLSLKGTGIEELPSSIGNIIGLRDLDLIDCEDLIFLPESLESLSYLSRLRLSGCSKLGCFPSIHGLNLTRLRLAYCNIKEIPDWLCSLSSLTYLDLRGNNFETIPSSIKQLDKLQLLFISHCKKLQHLPTLPLSILSIQASGCTALETIELSEAFKELPCGPGSVKVKLFKPGFRFDNCWKMDQSSRDNVLVYFLHYVQTWHSTGVRTCYPGNEIPDWFNAQWEGSIAIIKLPQKWLNYNILGFAICFAFEFRVSINDDNEDAKKELPMVGIDLIGSKRNDDAKVNLCTGSFAITEDLDTTPDSDHLFMLYCPNIKRDLMNIDEVEASIEYKVVEVKRCGLRLVYGQEAFEECPNSQEDSTIAEELICQDSTLPIGSYSKEIIPRPHDFATNSNSITDRFKEPTSITDQPQPSGTESINSDAEESSMQRIKRCRYL